MKKVLTLTLTFLTVLSALTTCGRQQSETSETHEYQETIDNRSEAEKAYDNAIYDYEQSYPYVSIVAFDEETQRELDAIPEKLKVYQDTFDVKIENPSELTEMLVKGALSDNHSDRLATASRDDCPNELLLKIAKDDPDRVIRFRALGNILSRNEFPVTFLRELTTSEYEALHLKPQKASLLAVRATTHYLLQKQKDYSFLSWNTHRTTTLWMMKIGIGLWNLLVTVQ